MERKLATIRKIHDITNIEGADSIELVKIDGWQVVVKKSDNLKINDLVIYCEIDSVLPERDEFEFLRERKFRIKTIKLRGTLSQGIVFPLSILNNVQYDGVIEEGLDVTDILDIKKYEIPIPASMSGIMKGNFPTCIVKTDAERIQNLYNEFNTWQKEKIKWTVSEKLDGCLDENTIIETKNGLKTIKEICENKYTGKIKSYDVETDEIYYDVIINHSILDNNNDWYEITLENDVIIKVTGNHMIWLPELLCYRKVCDLKENDIFLTE